jgi:hypothetical protein
MRLDDAEAVPQHAIVIPAQAGIQYAVAYRLDH